MADDSTYMATHNVTVTVTDVEEGTTTPVVTDRARLLARYDTIDNDGEIDRGEMRIAVAEFFADPPQLEKEDMRILVSIYFSTS